MSPHPAHTPLDAAARAFLEHSWLRARDGLLARSRIVRCVPVAGDPPTTFRYGIRTRWPRRTPAGVEIVRGELTGRIRFARDPFRLEPGEAQVLVTVDPECGLFHPNHQRHSGWLCVGTLGGEPYELGPLLEHVYAILTFQNVDPSDPADAEAARWWAAGPPEAAMLAEEVEPLW